MYRSIILSLLICFALPGFSSGQSEASPGNQRALYECSASMDIDARKIDHRSNTLYFQFNTEQKVANLKAQGFTWTEDNPEGYFEAFLVNTSDSTHTFTRQDGSLMMIQEAQNQDGEWAPIEYWVYSGCGNSYFNPLQLEPGKCVMVPIRKYQGELKTRMRLKLKANGTLFYSEPFAGSVSASQFDKETGPVRGILYQGPAKYLDDN